MVRLDLDTPILPSSDTLPPLAEAPSEAEYILVSDKTSEVLASCLGWENSSDLRKTASLIRKAGGEVTIFKAAKY